MYKELLPEHISKMESITANMQRSLDIYKQKEKASQAAISIQENQIFEIKQFLYVLNNALLEQQAEKIQHGDQKYLKGIEAGQTQLERSFKNTYHAGSFIKEFLNQLETVHNAKR